MVQFTGMCKTGEDPQCLLQQKTRRVRKLYEKDQEFVMVIQPTSKGPEDDEKSYLNLENHPTWWIENLEPLNLKNQWIDWSFTVFLQQALASLYCLDLESQWRVHEITVGIHLYIDRETKLIIDSIIQPWHKSGFWIPIHHPNHSIGSCGIVSRGSINSHNKSTNNSLYKLPSRKWTYPTSGKGKSSSKVPLEWDVLVPWRVLLSWTTISSSRSP